MHFPKILAFFASLAFTKIYASPPCNSSRPIAVCAEWLRPYSDNAIFWGDVCDFSASPDTLIADGVEFYDAAAGCSTPSLFTATCCAEFGGKAALPLFRGMINDLFYTTGCGTAIDCDGSETALPLAQTIPQLPSGWFTAIACAVDVPQRVISNAIVSYSSNNTPYNCVSLCASEGYTFAGVEYSDECYCGTGYAGGTTPPAANVSDCDMRCTGSYEFTCGGSWRMQIYASAEALSEMLGL
ncbi:Xylosyltransferase oxt [Grifola frondosa]|uniref:Xylosyltransferase oxt n=1 Tax=Grifola frondosa TaxID=5627 RepID=A0A1C7MIC1_GRIFR|nr:Xylosyltransferase oxt [Grifola frondosa]